MHSMKAWISEFRKQYWETFFVCCLSWFGSNWLGLVQRSATEGTRKSCRHAILAVEPAGKAEGEKHRGLDKVGIKKIKRWTHIWPSLPSKLAHFGINIIYHLLQTKTGVTMCTRVDLVVFVVVVRCSPEYSMTFECPTFRIPPENWLQS